MFGDILLASLAILYCSISIYYFNLWSQFLTQDEDSSSEDSQMSWSVVIALTSLVWFVAVPLSYNELIHKRFSDDFLYDTVESMSNAQIKVMGAEIHRRCPSKAKVLALSILEIHE